MAGVYIYQINRPLILLTLRQIKAIFTWANALSVTMIDTTVAFNHAILKFEPLELTPDVS